MRRHNRILIAEIVGIVVAMALGVVFLVGASVLLDGIQVLTDQVVSTTAQGQVDDVEGYGALVDLVAIGFGDAGILALVMLGMLQGALAFGSLIFAIIARVSHRPGKKGRYVVLTVLTLAPLGLIAIVALTFAFGDESGLLWAVFALVEFACIIYSIFETTRMLRDDQNYVSGGFGQGDFVPAPEDAR